MAITKEVLSKTLTPANLLGDGVAIAFGVSDYKNSRKQGQGKLASVGKAAGSFVWSEMYYSAMQGLTNDIAKNFGLSGGKALLTGLGLQMGVSLAQAGVSMAGMYWENTTKKITQGYANKGKFGSGYFNMSEAGYTMRQRSLNAIRSNGLNTQSVLGNEARTYYRSSL